MTKIKGSNILITGGGPALVKQWEVSLSKKVPIWQAILPFRVFDFIFGTVFGIYRTMNHFTGRNK
jgi:hypothetical protein